MSGSRFTFLGRIIASSVVVIFVWAYLSRNLMVAVVGSGILLYIAYRRMEFHGMIKNVNVRSQRKVLEDIVYKDSPFTVKLSLSSGEILDVQGADPIPKDFKLGSGGTAFKGKLFPGRSLDTTYSLVPLERGVFSIPPLRFKVTEGRGLFESEIVTDQETEIFVRASKKDIALANLMSKRKQFEITGPANRRHTRTFKTDLKSVRDYMPGDRFRDIDWKATSRLTKLMTREFETETNLPTMLLMDTSFSMRELVRKRTKLDHAVALAIQIAIVMNAQNHPVGMISFNETGVREHIIPGTSDVEKVLMSLFMLPNPIITDEYPGIPSEPGRLDDEGVTGFLKNISPFLDRRGRTARTRDGVTGIYEAFREMRAYEETGLLVVIITDMETNAPSLLRSVKMAVSRQHRVVVVSPFSWVYHLDRNDIRPEVLEKAYADHQIKQGLSRGLMAAGARVIEIGPRERGDTVLTGLRRMSR
ncbi:MAG: DUF58 domain-containing protein [Candidatus Thermoplasmatota archaeon]|nr:DUF58 domain-containing protein [Candidatus Thermoplasmatota archaeon]